MKIPYVLLDFSGEVEGFESQWDMTLIKDMLDGELWLPAQGYHIEPATVEDVTGYDGAIFVIPARQNAGFEKEIHDYLAAFKWCLVMLVGDEERTFDKSAIDSLPNKKIWLMQPKPDDTADFYLGSGYAPHTHDSRKTVHKQLAWFFSGQTNHPRRQAFVKELDRMTTREDMDSILMETDGFTQGMEPADYTENMAAAKALPAPSGVASPDSFRTYEALELGGVPVADDISALWPHEGYWRKVFEGEDVPFKIVTDLDSVEGYLCDVVREYPALNNKVYAWWQNYKRKMVYKLHEHVNELSGLPYIQDTVLSKITVIILTSPIKTHPSTAIIEQTINDIRKVLPYSEILIGVDGVRAEQEHYRERYEGYKQELIWKCNNEWSNVLPIVFENHMHQAAMTRKLLTMVKTPTLLFVEHDTALAPDFEYDWTKFVRAIEEGYAYTIRFHFEAQIPDAHKHLMIGEPEIVCGLPMLKTAQWSQRPHLSSTAFYRDMMERYFTDESRTMIEDKVHGYPAEAYAHEGLQGWYQWRLWIYHPEGHIKRSYTSDGRGDDPKYEMQF